MPGEPEFRTEARLFKESISLCLTMIKELSALGESLGISFWFMG
jgi:hypothetical protein